MKSLQKHKRIECPEYLKWVETLTCVLSEMPAQDAHHVIGVGRGGMATKDHDIFTLPLTRDEHQRLHNTPELWPEQWKWICMTIEEAFRQGAIKFDKEALKQLSKREY